MPLHLVEWKLATEAVVFSGKLIVLADDDAHAIERGKSFLGKEGSVANFSVQRVGEKIYEMTRNERVSDYIPSQPVPGENMGGPLFAFEIGARANVVASCEKVARTRLANAIKAGKSDGKYCSLLRVAVLDKEQLSRMSEGERNSLSKTFRKIQGGGVNPR